MESSNTKITMHSDIDHASLWAVGGLWSTGNFSQVPEYEANGILLLVFEDTLTLIRKASSLFNDLW